MLLGCSWKMFKVATELFYFSKLPRISWPILLYLFRLNISQLWSLSESQLRKQNTAFCSKYWCQIGDRITRNQYNFNIALPRDSDKFHKMKTYKTLPKTIRFSFSWPLGLFITYSSHTSHPVYHITVISQL